VVGCPAVEVPQTVVALRLAIELREDFPLDDTQGPTLGRSWSRGGACWWRAGEDGGSGHQQRGLQVFFNLRDVGLALWLATAILGSMTVFAAALALVTIGGLSTARLALVAVT
jgi:hypothetical protein